MDGLPVELSCKIFYNLDVKSIRNLSRVIKRYNTIYNTYSKNIYTTVSKRENTGKISNNLLQYLENHINIFIYQIKNQSYDIHKIKQIIELISSCVYKDLLYSYISRNVDFTYIINNINEYKNSELLFFFAINDIIPASHDNTIYDAIIRNMNVSLISTLFDHVSNRKLSKSSNAIFHRIAIELLGNDIISMLKIISITKPCFKFIESNILYDNITNLHNLSVYVSPIDNNNLLDLYHLILE